MAAPERRLAAIVSLDVVGFSRLMQRNERQTLRAIGKVYRGLIVPSIGEFGGHIFKTMGDALLAEFPSAVAAVEWVAQVQRAIPQETAGLRESGQSFQGRGGIALADMLVVGEERYGEGINLAVRVQGLSPPGGMAVTQGVHEYLDGKTELKFRDAGQRSFKNTAGALRIWVWHPEDSSAAAFSLLPNEASASLPSIVVLPFDNLSGDPEQSYFADGVVEEMTATLSRVRDFLVIARNSAFTYKGRTADDGNEHDRRPALHGAQTSCALHGRAAHRRLARLAQAVSGTSSRPGLLLVSKPARLGARIGVMLDLWYKNAIVYCLDVDTFMDANGDGEGDFRGLADRLDHLEALGINCIWLLPFYPSPNRDNGYDVTDFYNVDRRLGTLGDFVDFTRAAHDRGMRVIVDLVANHTSVDHPWFQEARRDPDSPYRDWFVWSKERPDNMHDGMVFPGVQESTWTYDEEAQAWYMHRFYQHQPDLNVANPAVREEIERIMGLWLELGVSGFRVDAVPFLVEYRGLDDPPERDPNELLDEMRRFLSWRKAEGILLGEANIPFDQAKVYFGDGHRLHVIFNFMLNQHTFLALARRSAVPVRKVLKAMPELPSTAHWGTFLRNHDELDLGRLSDEERQEVFASFGPDPDMQLYGRGLRRRLAPMLGGDLQRLSMAYSLIFAMPGMPVLWYGEEIGMGEDLSLNERMAVRTPMQWSAEPSAGFSTAPEDRLIRPVRRDGDYGYRMVNVEAQRDAPNSLMGRIQRLARTRRSCPEIGWGECRVLEAGEDAVLALTSKWQDEQVLTLHNFSDQSTEVRIDLGKPPPELKPLLRAKDGRERQSTADPIRLEAYDYCWFRVGGERR